MSLKHRPRTSLCATQNIRVGIYTRTSTDRQKKEGTIETQVEELEAYAASMDWEVTLIVKDAGVSGTIPPEEREGASRLMDVVESGGIDVVLVTALDRISRDSDNIDLPMFRRLLRKHKVKLFTPDGERKAETEEECLLEGMLGQVAAYERRKIRRRTLSGRRRAIRNGGRPRGVNLIGYDWDSAQKCFVINEDEAELIREVFRLAAHEGMRPFRISRDLKARGRKGGRDYYLFDSTIKDMLQRECFMDGKYRTEELNNNDGIYDVPPLIDRATWELVQANLAGGGRKAPSRKTKYRFLLRGIAKCSHCGNVLRGQHAAGRYPYYRCQNGVSPPLNKQRCAARRGLRADDVDKAVWEKVVTLLSVPGALDAEVARVLQSEGVSSDELRREIKRLTAVVAKLDEKTERLIDAVADGVLPSGKVRQRRDAIDEARAPLASRLQRAETRLKRAEGNTARLAVVDERLVAMREALPTLAPERRPDIVREFIHAAYMDTMSREITVEALILFDGDQEEGSSNGGSSGHIGGRFSSVSGTSTFYGNQYSPT